MKNKRRVLRLLSVLLMLLILLPMYTLCPAESIHEVEPDENILITNESEPIATMTPEELADYEKENDLDTKESETISNEERIQVNDLKINQILDDKGWINILLLGADSRTLEDFDRTDSIIILSINPESKKAKLTSVMRDTWVRIEGKGSKKINTANVYGGPQLVCRTINENFGMNIEKYVLVNMRSLATIIDMIGGIEVDEITEDELRYLNRSVKYDATVFKVNNAALLEKAGKNVHLTGNQALAYARIRHLDSDFKRVERQRNVLIAIARKFKEGSAISLMQLVPVIFQNVATNLTVEEALALVKVGLEIDVEDIAQLRLPADGTYSSGTKNNTYRIECNFEKNKKILYNFIYD